MQLFVFDMFIVLLLGRPQPEKTPIYFPNRNPFSIKVGNIRLSRKHK